jgi:hypothetical protein
MPMRSWARFGLALPAFAVALGLSHSLGSQFPVGGYDSDAYTLTFDSTGVFRYLKGEQLMVQGKYVVHDSTVSLTDEKGRDTCVGTGRNPGTYRWKLMGSALWFHTLHDPCPDRIRGLADQAWQPHPAG